MKKYLLIILLIIGCVTPSFAVFNEKDLPQTLSVLRFELESANKEFSTYGLRVNKTETLQHSQLMRVLDKCDELSLMLYSQKQDFTFDLTYSCHEVNKMYKELKEYRAPYLDIVNRLNIEIERYKDLKNSLERIPAKARSNSPQDIRLNKKVQADKKACLIYVDNLIGIYQRNMLILGKDDADYALASKRLNELNRYAQKRYDIVKRKIFLKGQDDYFYVLSNFSYYASRAFEDASDKYKSGIFNNEHSEWRGPMVIGFAFFVLIYLSIAVVLSNLIFRLLMNKVKWMQTEEFCKCKRCLILFAGSMIFALTVMVAKHYVSHNFFSIAAGLLEEYAWMLTVILASLLIRLKGKQINRGLLLYTPILIMGLLVITFRVMFLPNRMINLIFPPLLIVFIIGQLLVIYKNNNNVAQGDKAFAWISTLTMTLTAIVAWSGYVLLSLQIIIWWMFQLSVIQTITSAYYILRMYHKHFLIRRLRAYNISHKALRSINIKGVDIQVTWLFDFIKMTVVPVLVIYSIPYCTYMAADVFDLSIVCRTFYSTNILNVPGVIQLSPAILFVIASLFYIFLYANYAIKSFYRHYRIQSLLRKDGTLKLHANTANLTLFENLISIIVWGIYVVTAMVLLNIPKEGISLMTAGLATGVGFAMRDILNNFFYGIQLMAGRVRVGDFIECDGVRGKVESITYQSTQITTIDGCVMAFLNSALFSKNFKNLTRNHDYELVVIPVGVAYGSNINDVRSILLDAMSKLQVKDERGRDIVSKTRGVTVEVQNFGDNSVDLSVKQLVLVEKKLTYMSEAREIIYDALNEHGVEIPFPQRDVYIRKIPQKS